MSSTIMMSRQEFLQDVAFLAEKYGFDAEEANRLLDSDELKLARKREPVESPKTKKSKKADKADKPKRAKTGYLLYCDEMREEVRAKLTGDMCLEGDMKLRPQEVVKALAASWSTEDQETKDEWKQMAKDHVEFMAIGVE
jgi:hypothetical protein